jgi:hypothetical protein
MRKQIIALLAAILITGSIGLSMPHFSMLLR